MSRLVLAQDGRVMSLLNTFEPLSALPEQLRWEVWAQLPSWKRRAKAEGLDPVDRLARLHDETDPEVAIALAQGLEPDDVLTATASRPLIIRTLAHLGALSVPDREALTREMLLRASTRRVVEPYHWLVLDADSHDRMWCEFARHLPLRRVIDMFDDPDELTDTRRDVLCERLMGCHADSTSVRALVLKIMQYEPPVDPRRLIARTSRLGEAHVMLAKWARMERPEHVPEPVRAGVAPAEYESMRAMRLMTEACASNWFERSPDVADLDEDELRDLLRDVTHCARRASANPAFPRHLWAVVLECEDAEAVLDWWGRHPDADGREVASVLAALVRHGLRRQGLNRHKSADPITPERVNELLEGLTPEVVKSAFSLMTPEARARVAGELPWIGEHHPEVLGFLDVQSFRNFIDRTTALALVGWMKESLTTMRDWETFEAVCEANQEISVADALKIVLDVQNHPQCSVKNAS